MDPSQPNLSSINSTILPPPNRERKILLIAAIIIGVLAIITTVAVVTTIIILNRQPVATPTPPTTVIETPITAPAAVTKYASDAGILKLQTLLATTSAQVDAIDLFEAEIAPPVLDLSINIAPQP